MHVAVTCELLAVQFLINTAACTQWLNSELINQSILTRLLVPKQVAFVIWGIVVFALIWFEVLIVFFRDWVLVSQMFVAAGNLTLFR